MKNKFSLLIFSLILMLLLGSFAQVSACSCSRPSLCGAYNFADYIFIGKVIDKTEGVYTFEVTESFIGTKKGEQLKMLSGAGGSCAVFFAKDESYLIFGHQNSAKMREHEFWKNSFWTTVCDRNLTLESASEDLKFLRNISKKNVGGQISGKIYRNKWSENLDLLEIPFPDISVRITETKSNLLNKTLKTDSKGEFKLQVPIGFYEVTTDLPLGFQNYANISFKPFEIRNAGCANLDFRLEEIKKE